MTDFLDTLNLLGNLYNSGRGFVPKPDNNKIICSLEDDEYDYDECIEKSKKTVNFSEIIIKFSKDNWYNKPIKWYDDDDYIKKVESYNYCKKYIHLYKKYKVLDKINSKNYIKVVEPFMEIHLDKNLKQQDLTLEDILFATRSLCVDNTRRIDQYKILKQTDDMLILEPDIDNYST